MCHFYSWNEMERYFFLQKRVKRNYIHRLMTGFWDVGTHFVGTQKCSIWCWQDIKLTSKSRPDMQIKPSKTSHDVDTLASIYIKTNFSVGFKLLSLPNKQDKKNHKCWCFDNYDNHMHGIIVTRGKLEVWRRARLSVNNDLNFNLFLTQIHKTWSAVKTVISVWDVYSTL